MLYATLTEIPKIDIPNEHGGSTMRRFDRAGENPPQLRPGATRPGQYRPNLVAVVAFSRLGVGTTWRTWSSELVAGKGDQSSVSTWTNTCVGTWRARCIPWVRHGIDA
jgi:hypothetical protein